MKNAQLLLFCVLGLHLLSCNPSNAGKTKIPDLVQFAKTRVQVEIEPSHRSGYIRQRHVDVTVGELFGEGLELKPMVVFSGTLLKGNSKSAQSAISEIVATPIAKETWQTQAHSTLVDSSGAFALNLVAGQKYRLVANPAGRFGLPPTFLDVQLNTDYAGEIALHGNGQKVFGIIKQNSPLSNTELADKMWIRVMQGQRQVSSLGLISPSGEFSVTLADPLFEKDTLNHPLELIIESAGELSFFPTKRVPLIMGDKIQDIPAGTIDLGPREKLVQARFLVKTLEGDLVRDARVVVRALVENGHLQSSTTTNENGLGEVLVPAGQYDIAVVPKQDDKVGFRKLKGVELADANTVEIRLERRPTLTSTLFDESGNPIRGAQMLLTRFARADSNIREAILDSTELRIEARSNDKGEWCLLGLSILRDACKPIHLDSGRYRLSVTPPEGSRYPYYTQVFDFPERSKIEIVLKDAVALTGKILAPRNKTPVPNTFIRIYSTQIEKESGRPIFLTQAFTRSDGTFSVVLPQEYFMQTPVD
jgi:hypothetical protein